MSANRRKYFKVYLNGKYIRTCGGPRWFRDIILKEYGCVDGYDENAIAKNFKNIVNKDGRFRIYVFEYRQSGNKKYFIKMHKSKYEYVASEYCTKGELHKIGGDDT